MKINDAIRNAVECGEQIGIIHTAESVQKMLDSGDVADLNEVRYMMFVMKTLANEKLDKLRKEE